MQRLMQLHSLLFFLLILWGCNEIPEKHWINTVPDKSPFIIVPEENTTLSGALESGFIPFLDDISSSAIQIVSEIDSYPNIDVMLQAIVLYPGIGEQLQPIWVTRAPPNFTDKLEIAFYQQFTQNRYQFLERFVIHKLHISERILFATQIHDILLISESSLGIEDALRTYIEKLPRVSVDRAQLQPGRLVMNTPSLDRWIVQLSKVSFRPVIKNSVRGVAPAVLSVEPSGEELNRSIKFNGTIPITGDPKSEVVAALSGENRPLQLDRYISSNSAGFALFRLAPRLAPPSSVPDTTRLDSLLINDRVLYAKLARTMDPEFAMVMYAESGFLSVGEHLFIRMLSDRNALISQLNGLAREGYLQRREGTWLAHGSVLAKLIGSELSSFRDYYIDITGNAAVVSQRKGLAETIGTDRGRRRVIYYDQDFRNIRQNLPDELSGFFFANTEFYPFISSFLAPDNYVKAITSRFDLLAATLQLDEAGRNLAFNLHTYSRAESERPYEEKWFYPTGGAGLSGEPVLSDIGGSSRDEVIFALEGGSVYGLAADGTVVFRVNTEGERPVGSPIVYDWYGTDQNVVLLAAGNRIYGWNDTGAMLPKFPFELPEQITTRPIINDLNRDGLPEAIVTTADRRIHVLDGRGEDIDGWPVTTNSIVDRQPTVQHFDGSRTVIAYSENTVHAWFADGVPRSGYPKFINANFNGSPYIHRDHILGNAADGYLYAVGEEQLFADSLDIYSTLTDTVDIEAVYVSNSALTGSPSVRRLTVIRDESTIRENMILTMSSNGSVFLLSEDGRLRFTESMGEPSATDFSPFVTDINSDGTLELIALSRYGGRLYAWQVNDGERIRNLPTAFMQYPVIADLDGDGTKELIAQTRDGVRCWSIYGKR